MSTRKQLSLLLEHTDLLALLFAPMLCSETSTSADFHLFSRVPPFGLVLHFGDRGGVQVWAVYKL